MCPLSDEDENEFVPAGVLDENLLRARDAYRCQKGLFTSTEIAQIRGLYGLTQSDFSAMLGWGDITVTRYESKTIQDETYDSIMRMAHENPIFALENLDKHRERFAPEKYQKIRQSIADKVKDYGQLYLKRKEITSSYMDYQEESDSNGFRQLDIEKIASVIGYFSHFTNHLYKVKLMKLLWYADALHFRRHETSMTGLVYQHMKYGALPIGFEEIIYLPTVKIVEETIYDDICYRIIPNREVSISNFSFNELKVLETVTTMFRDFRAKDIVNYMHKEKGYTDVEPYEIIPYSVAKEN